MVCQKRPSGVKSANAALNPEEYAANLRLNLDVKRSPTTVPRIAPAMTNSETNVTSDLDDLVSESLRGLSLLGFAHAGTLAAMRGVPPVPASFALRLLSSSARAPVRLPRGFPPTPMPQFVSQPQTGQHGPLLAARRSAASISTRRSALTRQRWRNSERTPNHALQRTAALAFSYRCAALTRPAQSRHVLPP